MEVLIPEGYWFSMMTVKYEGLTNVSVRIDGTIKASKRHTMYPFDLSYNEEKDTWKYRVHHFLQFDWAKKVVFKGKGTVDGQGFMWWMREYIVNNPYERPNLIDMNYGQQIEFTGIRWLNSPMYNINVRDCADYYFHDFEIYTDIWGQFVIGQFFGQHDSMGDGLFSMPTFPLNTDGIDPSCRNVLIERVKITNFDDAVAVKPSNMKGKVSTCAENIMVKDCEIVYGVGMTIGSVPASDHYNCVRNVSFVNHTFHHPFKAIYVKTNPGKT